jgi:hypothetical protein
VILLLFQLGCAGGDDSGAKDTATTSDCTLLDPSLGATGSYQVAWQPTPDPMSAGVESDFAYQVIGPDGAIVDDLQQSHERMVHVLFISKDLEDFFHLHHEDQYALTADVLRCGSYHLPFTPPTSGTWRLAFDYAHENQYLATRDWAEVAGDVPQLDAPIIDEASERDVAGMNVAITWDTAPVTNFEAQWHIDITEGGEDVTDLVQYLGADAHVALVSEDAEFVSHTHAWVPGLENMTPGMEMPHEYPGPYIPFHFVFPNPGWHKMWIQFARAADPETPFLVDFWFQVAP